MDECLAKCAGYICVGIFQCFDKMFSACFPNPNLYPPMSEGAAKGIAYCLNILPFTSGFGTIIAACAGHVAGGNGIRCKIITMGIF